MAGITSAVQRERQGSPTWVSGLLYNRKVSRCNYVTQECEKPGLEEANMVPPSALLKGDAALRFA